MIHVFGHLNPDTDSVTSAIVYAWFLSSQGQETAPYVLGEPNKEAAYVLERFQVPTPQLLTSVQEGTEVVVVDTNNPEELLEAIANAQVIEIVDHHKLVGGITSTVPITVTMRPVACTATIIWERMQKAGITELPTHIASLMLAAIVSDTLKFTSPTTTAEDREVAEQLAIHAGVDADQLAGEMFAAKSDLTGMNAKDILLSDSKVYIMGERKIRLSSLETTLPEKALDLESEVLTGMEDLKKEEELDGLFFFIVDIITSASTLLLAGPYEKEVAAKAFKTEVDGNSMYLPGVVSRKKQMVPPLEEVITEEASI